MSSSTVFVYSAVVSVCLAQHACLAQEPEAAVALQGTFVRPADGIKHPDLDQAWADYRSAMDEATRLIEHGLQEAIEATQKRQDLDGVLRLQAALSLFQDKGIFPAAEFLKPDTHVAAARDIRRANAGLMDAYGELRGSLTNDGKIQAAKDLDAELGGLEAGLGFPPIPNVPERMFDGKAWDAWGNGWGEGHHEVDENEKTVQLKTKFFAFNRLIAGDFAFEADVRNHVWEFKDGLFQVGIQTDAGGCLVRSPERNQQWQLLPGWGEVVHYDHATKQDAQIVRFELPRAAKKWQTIRLVRVGNNLSVSIDGKQVVGRCEVPPPLRAECNPTIGAWGGVTDFKNLTITRIVLPKE